MTWLTKSLWSKLSRRLKLLRLLRSPGDAVLFGSILVFAAIAPTLHRLGLSRLGSLLEPRKLLLPPDPGRVEKIVTYVDTAMRLGRPLVRPGCLVRGTTLYYFLRRAGLEVSLCFGTGIDDDKFVGHCWLIKDGQPFAEATDPRPIFTGIYTIPFKQPT